MAMPQSPFGGQYPWSGRPTSPMGRTSSPWSREATAQTTDVGPAERSQPPSPWQGQGSGANRAMQLFGAPFSHMGTAGFNPWSMLRQRFEMSPFQPRPRPQEAAPPPATNQMPTGRPLGNVFGSLFPPQGVREGLQTGAMLPPWLLASLARASGAV